MSSWHIFSYPDLKLVIDDGHGSAALMHPLRSEVIFVSVADALRAVDLSGWQCSRAPSEVSSSGAAHETGIVGQCHATCIVQQLLERV